MRPSGHRWRIFTQGVFRTYGNNCHICGHGGAKQIDHLVPVTENEASSWTLENCRPSHGAPGNPCPVCTIETGRKTYCNQLRGMGSIERARRIIAERKAEYEGKARPEPPERQEDPGRAW